MSIFIRNQAYKGPVKAVILDWAGTAVDYGSIGPAAVFVDVFAKFEVDVSVADVRQFMGIAKKDHVRSICGLPSVVAQWQEKNDRPPDESDVERIYAETEPMMVSTIARHADLIPGLLETVESLRRQGIKIGSSTGYTSPMMEALVPAARTQGYKPDAIVCASDVPAGRPYPWMCYLNAIHLEVYPLEAMVKIGDTISDIEAGLNAGMWTIGLTQSGNELGLSQEEVSQLTVEELKAKTDPIERRYRDIGAHYVAAGIWDIQPLIDDINAQLSQGAKP